MTPHKQFNPVLVSVSAAFVLGFFNMSLAAEVTPPAATSEMVVTILSADSQPITLKPSDLKVYQGEDPRTVTAVERLSGTRAGIELFIYLDSSIDSTTLAATRPELEQFIRALPETTKVAVGNSIANQSFTTDREKAASSLSQPAPKSEVPGTWSNVLDLMRQWPLHDQADRRAILILTAGVSPEYKGSTADDLYAEAARRNAQIAGIAIYSILVQAGGASSAIVPEENAAQSNLATLSNTTGGHLYTALRAGSYSLRPFLNDLNVRLANQYRIAFEPKNYAGAQPVKVQTDMARAKVASPAVIYVGQTLLSAAGRSAITTGE
ncbi:MAG TPA: hypothetical protein VH351_10235 [Bryobacteraceae bacterium]|jgi:hypothetical protein|nr:hypothetical protein [Bryobacteraceae bacterium]